VPGPTIDVEELPPETDALDRRRPDPEALRPGQTLADARDTFERRLVTKVLAEMKGNVSRAAERLGLDRTTLHRRLRGWGLETSKNDGA
jgi:two-component system nitrogen regulation response regulator NtrX